MMLPSFAEGKILVRDRERRSIVEQGFARFLFWERRLVMHLQSIQMVHWDSSAMDDMHRVPIIMFRRAMLLRVQRVWRPNSLTRCRVNVDALKTLMEFECVPVNLSHSVWKHVHVNFVAPDMHRLQRNVRYLDWTGQDVRVERDRRRHLSPHCLLSEHQFPPLQLGSHRNCAVYPIRLNRTR